MLEIQSVQIYMYTHMYGVERKCSHNFEQILEQEENTGVNKVLIKNYTVWFPIEISNMSI